VNVERASSVGAWLDAKRDSFAADGFIFIHALLTPDQVQDLRDAVAEIADSREQAGVRGLLQRCPEIAALARSRCLIDALVELTSSTPFAVRGILFDKTSRANWRVAWHQDFAIAVRERADVAGFGPWSVKAGVDHTHAPAHVLERMLTVRVHLDDANDRNGALQVIPGSHHSGKLDEASLAHFVNDGNAVTCPARAGDALVMRPLLLHSSSPAAVPNHRRVIHLEYALEELPTPLKWFERIE
jgi:hypothetical protein